MRKYKSFFVLFFFIAVNVYSQRVSMDRKILNFNEKIQDTLKSKTEGEVYQVTSSKTPIENPEKKKNESFPVDGVKNSNKRIKKTAF